MKTLEKATDKIQKICNELRRETLEPAQKESAAIIAEAKRNAEKILLDAQKQAEKLIAQTRASLEQERNVFHSSLSQASRLSLESLRQAIEEQFFNNQLQELIKKETGNPQVIAKLIDVIIKAIEKEGFSTNISVLIPATVSTKEVNALLLEGIINKLREKSVIVGHFDGGVQVKLHDKKLTLDITNEALLDLLSHYLRKDFRKMLFAGESTSV